MSASSKTVAERWLSTEVNGSVQVSLSFGNGHIIKLSHGCRHRQKKLFLVDDYYFGLLRTDVSDVWSTSRCMHVFSFSCRSFLMVWLLFIFMLQHPSINIITIIIITVSTGCCCYVNVVQRECKKYPFHNFLLFLFTHSNQEEDWQDSVSKIGIITLSFLVHFGK